MKIVLFGLLFIDLAVSILAKTHPDSLSKLGLPISIEELDSVVAAGSCGQNPSVTGNPNCSSGDAAPCQENGQFPNFTCQNNNSENGSCTGEKHMTCQGATVRNGSQCYDAGLPPGACCARPQRCQTGLTIFTFEDGSTVNGTSCHTANAVNPPSGTRNLAISFHSAFCDPIE